MLDTGGFSHRSYPGAMTKSRLGSRSSGRISFRLTRALLRASRLRAVPLRVDMSWRHLDGVRAGVVRRRLVFLPAFDGNGAHDPADDRRAAAAAHVSGDRAIEIRRLLARIDRPGTPVRQPTLQTLTQREGENAQPREMHDAYVTALAFRPKLIYTDAPHFPRRTCNSSPLTVVHIDRRPLCP